MTPFQQTSAMNEAFNNPKGDPKNIDWERITKQCRNILDEYNELQEALATRDLNKIRDALCDIHVFAYGAHHQMGIDADADMNAVVNGVMTRFIKDASDEESTKALHEAKGVIDVYFEGEYPTRVMKSSRDQPDAPKGKFLKSASYKDTVFPPI